MRSSQRSNHAAPRNVIDPMTRHLPTTNTAGFTLVELIAVIIILGILSVVAISRFIDRGNVTPSSAQAQVISAARHAQQLAMNQGGGVILTTNNSSKQVTITPGSGTPITTSLPGDISITSANISYDALGDAHDGSGPLSGPLTLNITNGITRRVCIEPTGYAHDC